MFSRGSINGSEMNVLAINAGTFVLEMDSDVTVSIASTGVVLPRRGMSADVTASLDSQAGLLRRVTPHAHGVTSINGRCVLVRRPVFVGKLNIEANIEMLFLRRVSHEFTASVSFVGRATPAWRALHPTQPARIVVITDYRRIAVMREDRLVAIGPERRRIVVPRDREAIQ